MSKRDTDEYRAKAAARMRRLRADPQYAEIHRQRERDRYYKKRSEDPEGLRRRSRENARAWRRKHPEKAKAKAREDATKRKDYYRDYNLRKRYGIGAKEWDAIFTSQGKVCAVCRGIEARGWALDHCHTTGVVRGILCHPCNTALGFLADDTIRMRRMISYVSKAKEDQ